MNNLTVKTGVKFGLILSGFELLLSLLFVLTYDPAKTSNPAAAAGAFAPLFTAIAFAWAHYEFNQKNDHYISIKNAYGIGLIISLIVTISSLLSSILIYKFILADEMEKLSQQFPTANVNSLSNVLLRGLTHPVLLLVILVMVIWAESMWKIFRKADKEGWAALVPIYNTITLLEIVGKPGVWLLFLFIPGLNIIFAIWITNLLAKRFGKDEGFTIGLIILPFIFYPLLGMSKEQYTPPEDEWSTPNPDGTVNTY